jgi:hypothetical protein
MLPISEQYLYSSCEIESFSNKLITIGYLGNIRDDGIQILSRSDILPILHCNMPVKININNKSLGFKVLVGKVFLSSPEMMQITDLQNLADFDRRNFFRLRVKMEAVAYLLQSETPDTEHPLAVTVTDLSLSGAFITTTEPLEFGQKFMVTLKLSNVSVPFCCQVQREQFVDYTHKGYGCAFSGSSPRQFDLLCSFIFNEQREQIKMVREAQDT